MYYVYLIRSLYNSDKLYIGYTQDLKKRFTSHNAGSSPHTSKYKPWELVMYLGFKNKSKAIEFEKFLKSGSGNVFAKRRLW